MTPEERVLRTYYDRLSAFQVEKSRVIAIEFESQDPELAARVANAIADAYLVLQRSAKQEQTRAAGVWLAGEIENLRNKTSEAEARVEAYRAKTNLFVGTNNTMLSNQQLGDLNAQLSAARAQKADAAVKARLIREALHSGAPVEFSDITNSELMRRLSEQRVTLRAQLAEQSSTLLDQHPRIKELRAQIADLERQMRTEADRLARTFENDAKLANARVETLSTNLDQLKHQAVSTNEQDVQLRALERDAKSQRDLLESYLAKYREASARDNIGAISPEARIISTAIVSNTPAWPKKLPTVLVAALGMFALSAGFVLTGDLLGGAAFAPRAGVPFDDDELPPQPLKDRVRSGLVAPRIQVPIDEPHAAAELPLESIEQLASELSAAGEAGRRIAVIGARRKIGATLSAITLGRMLAARSRVVLVDLALNAPSLGLIATEPDAPGIGELVAGTASFGQVITRDRFSPAHVITAGRLADGADAVLSSQRLAITIEALARSYEHVVLEAGGLSDIPPERLAQLAPCAVLVADAGDNAATAAARETLLSAGFTTAAVLASGSAAAATAPRAAA
jgi:Mrp family chromosome partitioning ATPase